MKANIHPQYFVDATVTCACGNTFVTASTKKSIFVEICYKCHPLFTGEEKLVDIKGRVDKFKEKVAYAEKKQAEARSKRQSTKKSSQTANKTLKDLLSV